MNGAMITGHTQEGAVTIEVDTVDVGRLGASPQFCQDVATQAVKHSDQCSLGAGSGHLGPLDIELDD